MVASMNRRRFLGTSGAGFAAAMLTGGALPAGFGKSVLAQDGGKEYHGAYPYTDPGAGGHFNTFVTNGILSPPATVYGEVLNVPLGMFFWDSNSWLPLVAEGWEFKVGADDLEVALPVEGENYAPLDTAPVDADTLVVKVREA